MGYIVPLLFYKNIFGIKWHTKVDMPLNKEIKINQIELLKLDNNLTARKEMTSHSSKIVTYKLLFPSKW